MALHRIEPPGAKKIKRTRPKPEGAEASVIRFSQHWLRLIRVISLFGGHLDFCYPWNSRYPWSPAFRSVSHTLCTSFRWRIRAICATGGRRFPRRSAQRRSRDLSRDERLPIRIRRSRLACRSVFLARGPLARSTWFAHSTERFPYQRWTAPSHARDRRDPGDARTFRSSARCPAHHGKDTGE